MNINESMDLLSKMFKHNDWFFDIEIDKNNNLVMYTHWMNGEILKQVPSDIEGHQVFLHFSSAKLAKREDFVNIAPIPLVNIKALDVTSDAEYLGQEVELSSSNLELDLSDLIKNLDSLEKICGTNILQDIFYEIHDEPNNVTNLSAKFPEIRKSLENLYDRYGFDIIYEELDG